ncbi:unnamed protein product [Urochloa humidicola]
MLFGRNKSSSSTTPTAPPSKAAAACSEWRAAYHDCFNRWYADKFAKGQFQKDDCTDHWHKYRACLEEHLEDKHLRQILLDAETSAFYEADPPSGQGSTK